MKHEVQVKTKKVIKVSDLKDTDNVGFKVKSGDLGYIVFSSSNQKDWFTCITIHGFEYSDRYCNIQYGNGGETLQDALKCAFELSGDDTITDVYLFDTRKELYQWLAED